MYKKLIFVLLLFIAMSGCAEKKLIKKENQQSAFIIYKTPKIKYADMGFIYKGDSFTKIEIYGMGQPIMTININGMNVCMSTFECMEKPDFNRRMLVASYPDTLLENIFRGEPIFNGENLKKDSNGFTQSIKKKGEYDITYSVTDKRKYFKDKINKIKIEVKDR